MTEPTSDELYAQVLLCPMGTNSAEAETVGEYLQVLLETVWIKTDEFSGKRPFGTSSWPYELYEALIQGGFVEGIFDEDGYLDEFPEEELEKADDLIIQAVDYAFRPWRLEVEDEEQEEEDLEEDEDLESEEDGTEFEDEEAEQEEEHAANNGFAARDSIVMAEITTEPVLLLADDVEDDGSVQIVGFVQVPEDDDNADKEDDADSFVAPPTGIRDVVPDAVPEAWTTDDPGSPSQPMPEDLKQEDSPAPESQPQTQPVQNTPPQGAGVTE